MSTINYKGVLYFDFFFPQHFFFFVYLKTVLSVLGTPCTLKSIFYGFGGKCTIVFPKIVTDKLLVFF